MRQAKLYRGPSQQDIQGAGPGRILRTYSI